MWSFFRSWHLSPVMSLTRGRLYGNKMSLLFLKIGSPARSDFCDLDTARVWMPTHSNGPNCINFPNCRYSNNSITGSCPTFSCALLICSIKIFRRGLVSGDQSERFSRLGENQTFPEWGKIFETIYKLTSLTQTALSKNVDHSRTWVFVSQKRRGEPVIRT